MRFLRRTSNPCSRTRKGTNANCFQELQETRYAVFGGIVGKFFKRTMEYGGISCARGAACV